MRTIAACLLLLCSAATCQTGQDPVPPPAPTPEPTPEPSPVVQACRDAAATVERLGCAEEWGIDERDGSFFDLCIRAETEGSPICPLDIATAETCGEADAITQECAE